MDTNTEPVTIETSAPSIEVEETKEKKDPKTIQSVNWEFVLYPESEVYDYTDMLNKITERFKNFAYVKHDKDTDENGEIKKAHTHLLVRNEGSAVRLSTIQKDFPEINNSFQRVKNWRAAIRYLIHADAPDKFQYPVESIISNFDHGRYFGDIRATACMKAIHNFIVDNYVTNPQELIAWSFENNCFSEVRRGWSMWMASISYNIKRLENLK